MKQPWRKPQKRKCGCSTIASSTRRAAGRNGWRFSGSLQEESSRAVAASPDAAWHQRETSPTDAAFLRGIARGNRNGAFDRFDARWRPKVFSFYWHKTSSREDAQDLSQAFFVRVLKKAGQYRGGSARAWLWQTARRILYSFWRRQKSTGDNQTSSLDQLLPDGGEDWLARSVISPATATINREEIALINLILLRLPQKQREAFTAIVMNGEERAQFAKRKKVSCDTVWQWLSRARKTLREEFAKLNHHADSVDAHW